jgi:hypothetical protein
VSRIIKTTFIILFTFSSWGSYLKFNKDIPKELQYLISELFANKKIQEKDLTLINNYFNTNSDHLPFITDVIYKYSVAYTKAIGKKYQNINQKMYETSKANLAKINDTRVFSKFLYDLILKDLDLLLKDPLPKTYSLYIKKREKVLPPEVENIGRRITYVTPWLRSLQEKSQEELDLVLDEYTSKMLRHLMKVLSLTRSAEAPKQPKRYVWMLDKQLEDVRKSIDALTFEVSPKPFKDYKAPKVLPQEVDDWIPVNEEIIEDGLPLTKDRLFPRPDPDYTPPPVLPKPVDSWE